MDMKTAGDITAVMITVDRRLKGKSTNYLASTIARLGDDKFFANPRLRQFILCDSLSDLRWAPVYGLTQLGNVRFKAAPDGGYLACESAGHALICGGLTGAKWVLFLEDDIDICRDFLGSVGRFLDQYGNLPQYRLFAFGADYGQLIETRRSGGDAWPYPVSAFFGTQCFAIRSEDAVSLGRYIYGNPMIRGVYNPNAYDLMFHDWANVSHPGCKFLASAPSFVQHIGRESVCTGKEETHRFESWLGREWTYNPSTVVKLAI